MAVHQRELVLVLEVRGGPQPAYHRAGAPPHGVLDGKPAVALHLDARQVGQCLAEEGHALVGIKEQTLRGTVVDGDHDLVEEVGGALDDVQMAVMRRIESSRINCAPRGGPPLTGGPARTPGREPNRQMGRLSRSGRVDRRIVYRDAAASVIASLLQG